eukprot:ANDGO_08228.mRNA.1 hypothetical protein
MAEYRKKQKAPAPSLTASVSTTSTLKDLGICNCKSGCETFRCSCKKGGRFCDPTRCGCCNAQSAVCKNLDPSEEFVNLSLEEGGSTVPPVFGGDATDVEISRLDSTEGLFVYSWNIQSFGGRIVGQNGDLLQRFQHQRNTVVRTILHQKNLDVIFIIEVMNVDAVKQVHEMLNAAIDKRHAATCVLAKSGNPSTAKSCDCESSKFDSCCVPVGTGYNISTQDRTHPEFLGVLVRRKFSDPRFSFYDNDTRGLLEVAKEYYGPSVSGRVWKRLPVLLKPIRVVEKSQKTSGTKESTLRLACFHLCSDSSHNMLQLNGEHRELPDLWKWMAASTEDASASADAQPTIYPILIGDMNRNPSARSYEQLRRVASCAIFEATNMGETPQTYDHVWVCKSWFSAACFRAGVIRSYPFEDISTTYAPEISSEDSTVSSAAHLQRVPFREYTLEELKKYFDHYLIWTAIQPPFP